MDDSNTTVTSPDSEEWHFSAVVPAYLCSVFRYYFHLVMNNLSTNVTLSTLGHEYPQFLSAPALFLGAVIFCLLIAVYNKRWKMLHKVKLIDSSQSILSVFDMAKTAYEPGHTESVKNLIEQFDYGINSPLPNNGLTIFLILCLYREISTKVGSSFVSYEHTYYGMLMCDGADIHTATMEGDSALYLATYGILSSPKPDIQLLELLIKEGCEVNKVNSRGYTPLHRAASKGSSRLIHFFLKHGADPYIASNHGIFPIDSAINAGHLEAAELLKVNISNPYVWDVVDPHTPSRIKLGLQSPQRKHMVESTRRRSFTKVLS